jgi:hypothetical protein
MVEKEKRVAPSVPVNGEFTLIPSGQDEAKNTAHMGKNEKTLHFFGSCNYRKASTGSQGLFIGSSIKRGNYRRSFR